jgi:hypothetical protein
MSDTHSVGSDLPLSVFICGRKRLSWRPGHGASPEHMHVKMEHGLAGAGPSINHRTIPTLPEPFIVCHPRGNAKQMP